MDLRAQVFLLLIFAPLLVSANHQTSIQDVTGLRSLMALWTNTPPNWRTPDPCEDGWDGIGCTNMRVVSLTLSSMNLTGTLSGDIQELSELQILDISYNKGLTGPLPPEIGSLTKLTNIILVGCSFSGPIPPSIGSLQELISLDLSNNSFEVSDIPAWFSTLESLTTLIMENTHLQGEIPTALFSLSSLQTVVLKNNLLSGTLDIGTPNSELELIDLQNNLISEYKGNGGYNVTLILVKNPVCEETGASLSYCKISQPSDIVPYETVPNNCVPSQCSSDQVSSPNCKCAYPYEGTLIFRAPTFSDLDNSTRYKELEKALTNSFLARQLNVDSVSLSNPTKDSLSYLRLNIAVIPEKQDRFTRKDVSGISYVLSNQTFKPQKSFGPVYFIGGDYEYFAVGTEVSSESNKSSNVAIIIGAAAGCSVLVLVLTLVGIYAIRQKRRAKRAIDQNNPFGKWDENNKSRGSVPQLKGTRAFSFEELVQYSNNFSEENDLGTGGYGKVHELFYLSICMDIF